MNKLPPSGEAAPLGILGGTFDPIHLGHLRLAEEAREALGLGQVLFVPAGSPPHRGTPRSSGADRLALARLATADNPAFAVDDGEVMATGKSYTLLTLERLRAAHGCARPLVLILGADAFQGLTTWHRWRELFGLAHVAVATRAGYASGAHAWPQTLPTELASVCAARTEHDPAALYRSAAGTIVPFEMTPLAISASLVRELIGTGRSARYLLPDSVLDYIGLHHLYCKS